MSLKRRTKLKIWGWVCILIGVIGFISIIIRATKPRTERLGCHRSLFVIQEEYLRKFTSTPQAFYPMESSWVHHDCHQ